MPPLSRAAHRRIMHCPSSQFDGLHGFSKSSYKLRFGGLRGWFAQSAENGMFGNSTRRFRFGVTLIVTEGAYAAGTFVKRAVSSVLPRLFPRTWKKNVSLTIVGFGSAATACWSGCGTCLARPSYDALLGSLRRSTISTNAVV